MTRLKNGSTKGDEAPRHRLPSNISPVSSSFHSVGTSAEPHSLSSITPNAREQAYRDRIKAPKNQDAAKKEEVVAKPPPSSTSITNSARMASPEVIVRETTSSEKVVEVATHVAADRNAAKERPSYDNDRDESDLFVRGAENCVSSKCDTPMKSVTPERESIPKASTETGTEAAPVVVAGSTQPAPSEETATKKPEAPAKSERATRTNQTIPSKRAHGNDNPSRVHAHANKADDDSSSNDVPVVWVRRLGSSKSGGSTWNTNSPTKNGSVRATPSKSFWGRENSDNAGSGETPVLKAYTPSAQGSGCRTLPPLNQSSARKAHTSVSKSPLPSVEDSGRKRVLIPARRAFEDLGHTAKTKSASERITSQTAPTPSEESSAPPRTKALPARALSAVPDSSRELESKKNSSAGFESKNVTDMSKQVIDPADAEDYGEVTMITTEVPTAPGANMKALPQPPPAENKERIKVVESPKSIELTKSVEPTKSLEPKDVEPENAEPENGESKREEPENGKLKEVKPKSDVSKIAKPTAKTKAKKSPAKNHSRLQQSAKVDIIGHRKMAKGDFDFELRVKEGNTTWWDEEVDMFSKSPEIVSDYWNSVRGGRERACDGMWKIWKIYDERKVGNRKESLVGWLGSMDRTWEPKAYVLQNALEVLKEWEQEKAEEKEAKHTIRDRPDDEKSGREGPLKLAPRKSATRTRTRKNQAYPVKKSRRTAI